MIAAASGVAVAQDAPRVATKGTYSVTYSPHAAGADCNVNLGPTGSTAWMRGYHFVVTSIQQGSPGYGQLKLGDVILGAAGKSFGPDVDPRITLGNAIGVAEATGEPLVLDVLRDGAKTEVKVPLPKLGAYPAVGMSNCEKSDRILDAACRSLIDSQMPNGGQITDGAIGTFLTGLILLGSGESEFLDAARRAAYRASEYEYEKIDYSNWPLGYGGVTLAEYYLATGDDSVLPKLKEITDQLAAGQMRCGSWGHNNPGGGYGAVNQLGLVDAIALVMARDCGVEVDGKAIDKTLHFFSRFAGLGSVPYGDHQPFNSLDNNGANSSAAVLFHLAGRETEAKLFAESVADSYWLREEGHTGAFFSILWGPMAASIAGPEKYERFIDYQKWYYDMAREWTGGITFLPYKEALTRFDDSGYIYFGPDFTTGGMAMAYALPRKKLQIFGAPASVFSVRTKLDGDLKTARDQYLARDWNGFDATLKRFESVRLDAEAGRSLSQLQAAREFAKASIDRTLLEIDSNLTGGAAYRASRQFEALKRAYGANADPRFAEIEKRLAASEWFVREGKDFYERWEGINAFTVKSWVPQGPLAKWLLEGTPTARLPIWEPLSPTSQLTPQTWRTRQLDAADAVADGWQQPGFDDSAWTSGEGIATQVTKVNGKPAPTSPIVARRTFTVDNPKGKSLRVRLQTVRNAETKVYLNGQLIVNVERGQRGGYAPIKLQDSVFDLLKQGENVLAIWSSAQGTDANRLDVGLEICRVGADPRHLPIERYEHIDTAKLPDAETSLQVSRTMDQYRESLTSGYAQKSVDDLLKEMSDEIGYYRGLAEEALVGKGPDGIRPAIARMGDADWKVRVAAMGVFQKASNKAGKDKDDATLALLAEHVPLLIKHVTDEHHWVRTQACKNLGDLGPAAKDAIPVLVEASGDKEEWVRTAALGALRQIGADATTLHAAAIRAHSIDNSSYSVARHAMAIVKMPEGDTPQKLKILSLIIQTPPQGDGGGLLNDAMATGCKLDPDGTVMIPILIDGAADKTGLGRQRQNPRGAAIEHLGNYGPKASAATETLKAILADDKAKNHHEVATAALKKIAG